MSSRVEQESNELKITVINTTNCLPFAEKGGSEGDKNGDRTHFRDSLDNISVVHL